VRVRLPICLLFACAVAFISQNSAYSQIQSDIIVKTFNGREMTIPFKTDPKKPIKQLRLYAQHGSSEWKYLASAKPSDKVFRVVAHEDGEYALSVQIEFQDGTTDVPVDRLTPQIRILVDTAPPKIQIHAFSVPDGAGVEWDITDDNIDPSSIRLEYRWPGQLDWRPIDQGVNFRARDQRIWTLRTDQRIEIRVKARDTAKNEAVSAAVWTSLNAGEQRKFSTGSNSGGGEPFRQEGPMRSATSVHYVSDKELNLELNIMVGPSGLKRVRVFRSDSQQEWKETQAWVPPAEHPASRAEERARTEHLSITHVLEKEGEYGFILIPESKAGKAMPLPKAKDPAQIRVVVDMTPPKVIIKETKVRKVGDDGVAVDITWSAEDLNMAGSPISIKYSKDAKGPWLPVTSNLDNTGHYTWNVSTSEQPHSFYLKIEAVDRAGNVGDDVTREPVELDLVVPQVEIQSVTPAKDKKDKPKDREREGL
jgi:hypothetical protein